MSKVEKNRERVYFGGISFKLNASDRMCRLEKILWPAVPVTNLVLIGVYVFQGSQTWFHKSMLLKIFFLLKLNVQVCRTFLRSIANQRDVFFN